jgi:hypothetical protein
MIAKIFRNIFFQRTFYTFCILIIWFFLRRIYRDRIGAFGCFDDCFNILGGWFVLQGKHVFSEIFFNHQPLMAYISAGIQYVYHPETPYLLIYNHRMILIWYAILWNLLLIWRFGFSGFLFSVFYETTKAYMFGDRFLAESFITYPLVYTLSICISLYKKLQCKISKHEQESKFSIYELLFITLCMWFVIFMREPYIFLAIFLYGVVLFLTRKKILIIVSLLLFVGLSIGTIFYHSIYDYYFNVITVNTHGFIQPLGAFRLFSLFQYFLSILFYPFTQLFYGSWNIIHFITAGLSLLLIFLFLLLIVKKQFPLLIGLVVVLFLSNLRFETPGVMYYGAFHMLVWYSQIMAIDIFLISYSKDLVQTKLIVIPYLSIVVLLLIGLFNSQSFLWEKVDRVAEFTTNFAQVIVPGEIISELSNHTTDTLFVEARDDFIYWVSKTKPAYTYSWFTSIMPNFQKYTLARTDMFQKNPPTFYYGLCNDSMNDPSRNLDVYKTSYVELKAENGISACIFIRKDKIASIGDDKWNSISKYNIKKPDM